MMNREYAIINGNNVDVTTVFDKTVQYIPNTMECEEIIRDARELLEDYFDCLGAGRGLEKMFGVNGEFWKAKGWLISAFKKHPCYNGKYQIVLRNQDMIRHINQDDIYEFFQYFYAWYRKNRIYVDPDTGELLSVEEKEKIEGDSWEKARHYRNKLELTGYQVYRKAYRKERLRQERLAYATVTKEFKFVIEIMQSFESMLNRNEVVIDDDMFEEIEEAEGIYDVKLNGVRSGHKISKTILKLAKMIGIDKHADIRETSFIRQDGEVVTRTKDLGWNYQYARLCDSINPTVTKATVVISVNPLDFWTMSFGKGWASCHTIDKKNRRRVRNGYQGMYCGGTESNMFDTASVVFYYLPEDFNGDCPELEDKLKRVMFYLGEDKLIQSRVYPDGRDGGEASLAGDTRRIMQKVVSELWDVPNYWKNERGTSVCGSVISSYGPHYRDYLCYDDCNVSFMRRIDGHKNVKTIKVGSEIICPNCGDWHETEDNIFCDYCAGDKYVCQCCGDIIRDEEDVFYVDGEPYCRYCVEWCSECDEYVLRDEMVETNRGDVCGNCAERWYVWSEYEGMYIHDNDSVLTEDGEAFLRDGDGWFECDECGNIYSDDDGNYDEETGNTYCDDCYEELLSEREEEENDEEN